MRTSRSLTRAVPYIVRSGNRIDVGIDPQQGTSLQKTINNKLFIAATDNLFREKPGNIVYLDGISCRTTKMFLEAGCPSEFLIPVNFGEAECKNLRQLAPNTKHAPFNKIISEIKNITALWYDGCKTINGNKKEKIYPIDDVSEALKYIQSPAVFAWTYCQRKGIKYNEADKLIADLLLKKGFKPHIIHHDKYANSMAFYLAVV